MAANPGAAPALSEELTGYASAARKVLREVARHPRASPALLVRLADRDARRVAAGRPALPPPVLLELPDDADPQVAQAAASNPSLPGAVMADLVNVRSAGPGSQPTHS
ncbi:hypothetical protein ACIQFU_07790 [Streptomyces sp. NPDC093065]|uniref:hypothetical protein n=1 Tax=Streptomyces sp. NPDC093065 TaxID=3366021 RepID=UPI0037F64339